MLQSLTWKKTGLNGSVYDFSVDLIVLILVISYILINIQWKKERYNVNKCLDLLSKHLLHCYILVDQLTQNLYL